MNRSSSHGFKLTKVLLVVVVLGVSALMSNSTTAEYMEVNIEQEN